MGHVLEVLRIEPDLAQIEKKLRLKQEKIELEERKIQQFDKQLEKELKRWELWEQVLVATQAFKEGELVEVFYNEFWLRAKYKGLEYDYKNGRYFVVTEHPITGNVVKVPVHGESVIKYVRPIEDRRNRYLEAAEAEAARNRDSRIVTAKPGFKEGELVEVFMTKDGKGMWFKAKYRGPDQRGRKSHVVVEYVDERIQPGQVPGTTKFIKNVRRCSI